MDVTWSFRIDTWSSLGDDDKQHTKWSWSIVFVFVIYVIYILTRRLYLLTVSMRSEISSTNVRWISQCHWTHPVFQSSTLTFNDVVWRPPGLLFYLWASCSRLKNTGSPRCITASIIKYQRRLLYIGFETDENVKSHSTSHCDHIAIIVLSHWIPWWFHLR